MSTVTVTQTTAGSYNWVCPDGVFSVQVECWAGGGNGGDQTGTAASGGGGGGEYAKETTLSVVPGTTYPYVVGAAGAQGATANAGGNSTFNSTSVVAHGGSGVAANATAGGAGGTGSTNTTHFNGGAGATGATNSGGGGGSGGTASAGNAATTNTGATAVTGGGPGGNGTTSSANGSAPASGPGGGGGGAKRTTGTRIGGAGFAGQVIITYTTPFISSLRDDFSTQNTDRWTGWGANFAVVSGKAHANPPSGVNQQLTGAWIYDLTGTPIRINPSGYVQGGGALSTVGMFLYTSDDNYVGAYYEGMYIDQTGTLFFEEAVNAVATFDASVAYNSTTHAWWAIYESGGTIYWLTSADGKVWTTQTSHVKGALDVTRCKCILYVTSNGSGLVVDFDNVNNSPPVGRQVIAPQAVKRASLW